MIDPKGRIWLEKRAATTDTYPGYYNSSAAGHISRGESYLEGAQREALEELGIKGLVLERKHTLQASKETSNEFVAFFIVRSDEKPRVHADSLSLHPYSAEEIDRMIARGEKFVPIFLKLFKWHKGEYEKVDGLGGI